MKQIEHKYLATAFISQSLRPEDKPFVDLIEKILKFHRIKPTGTVGKHYVAPENIAVSVKENISSSDFLVACASPRYFQTDIHNGKNTNGLPEMIHTEIGMAYSMGKPVIAFVIENTNIGNILPNITQYIILKGDFSDFKNKEKQIYSLLNNTYKAVKKNKDNNNLKKLGIIALVILAIIGIFTIFKMYKDRKKKLR